MWKSGGNNRKTLLEWTWHAATSCTCLEEKGKDKDQICQKRLMLWMEEECFRVEHLWLKRLSRFLTGAGGLLSFFPPSSRLDTVTDSVSYRLPDIVYMIGLASIFTGRFMSHRQQPILHSQTSLLFYQERSSDCKVRDSFRFFIAVFQRSYCVTLTPILLPKSCMWAWSINPTPHSKAILPKNIVQ